MAETLETPTPSLAERDTGDLADDIEAWADVDASNLRSGSRVTSAEQLMGREPDLRAAAAQLREKDAEIERWKAKATELGEALRLDLKGIVNVMEEVPVERIAELEAQLRQLDRIKTTTGSDDLREIALRVGPEWPDWMRSTIEAIADALEADDGA